MNRQATAGLMIWAILTASSVEARSETFWLDLTHPIPTFQPVEGNPIRSDLQAPWRNSTPHVTWYQQAILTISKYSTDTGYYDSGKLVIDEHYGTHLDAINHIPQLAAPEVVY